MITVVVTGANRGIGLAIAREYRRRGNVVIGTARDTSLATELCQTGAECHCLDVTKEGSVAALAVDLSGRRVDLLVNNAGVGREGPGFESLDFRQMIEAFDVNCIGTMRVIRALLPCLRAGSTSKIINITSALGSISENTDSRWYAYRASKAALNMMTRNIAHDLRGVRIACVAIHPGWVRTRMGGKEAPLLPADAASRLASTIGEITLEDTGSFLDLDGNVVPW